MDVLYRIFLGSRPIDLVVLGVDVLVLLFIAPAEIAHLVHWLRVRHRLKRVCGYQVRALALQDQYREEFRTGKNAEGAGHWIKAVDQWTTETKDALARYSMEAAAAFMRDSTGVIVKWGDQNSTHASHAWLNARLSNLHEIIDRADRYF